jgi:hypothetical protein
MPQWPNLLSSRSRVRPSPGTPGCRHFPSTPGKDSRTSSYSTSKGTDPILTPWSSCHSASSKRRKPFGSTTKSSSLSSHNCHRSTTTSRSITPSVAFGLVSYTVTASAVTASGTHPKTSKSYISYSRSMPDPKSYISERSNLKENLRTLRSLAEPGPSLRSQTPDGTAAVSSRCTT